MTRPHRVRLRAAVPRHPPRAAARVAAPRWHALLVALLLAFSWQSFVVQTHVHEAAPAARAAGPAANGPYVVGGNHRREAPASCPICREAAHAGRFLPAAPVALAVPAAVDAWLSVELPPTWARPSRSHAWRSRGPPAAPAA